jgi:hypothetical protein
MNKSKYNVWDENKRKKHKKVENTDVLGLPIV